MKIKELYISDRCSISGTEDNSLTKLRLSLDVILHPGKVGIYSVGLVLIAQGMKPMCMLQTLLTCGGNLWEMK